MKKFDSSYNNFFSTSTQYGKSKKKKSKSKTYWGPKLITGDPGQIWVVLSMRIILTQKFLKKNKKKKS